MGIYNNGYSFVRFWGCMEDFYELALYLDLSRDLFDEIKLCSDDFRVRLDGFFSGYPNISESNYSINFRVGEERRAAFVFLDTFYNKSKHLKRIGIKNRVVIQDEWGNITKHEIILIETPI